MAIYTRTGDRGETGVMGGMRVSKGSMQLSVIGTVDELNSTLGLAVAMMESIRQFRVSSFKFQEIDIGLARLIGQLRDIQRELFEMGAALAANNKIQNPNDKPNPKSKIQIQKSEVNELETRNWKLETRQMQRMAEEFVKGDNEGSRKGLGEFTDREQDAEETRRSVEDKERQGLFDAKRLEAMIDEMEADLPRLENFVLPGGGVVGAQLMVARTVCRRTEREFVRYSLGEKRKAENEKLQSKSKKLNNNMAIKHFNYESDILRYLNRLSDYLFVASRWVNWLMEEEESVWRRN